jgi:type I restriction enzyme S subunit
LSWFINAQPFRSAVAGLQAGSTRKRISRKNLGTIPLPVPPLPEQRRIVAEIEKQFTRLEAGVAALRRVQANLHRYRAAVLKAACEGRLVPTEAETRKKFETGAQLLQRILKQRRENWTGKGKYKEPAAPDTTVLPKLPDGWCWANFPQLDDGSRHALKAGPFGSSLKKSVYVPKGYKIYGQEQVIRGDPYYGDYYIGKDLFEQLRSCEVKPGDVLISLVGTTGRVLILPDDIEPGIINPRLVKLSLNKTGVNLRYVRIFLQSSQARAFFKFAAHGGTMEIINLGILKDIPVPLPPLAEQERIVAEVERRLSVVEELSALVTANLQRATRLRQSILQQAFEGKLSSSKSPIKGE